MRVGLLIPTYNRRAFLAEALASARAQTHDALEIVVIDNGSTDGTAETTTSIVDPRVRYVVNPQNLGMAGSVNRGIRMFSPEVEWCSVLSDDDLLDPGCIGDLLQRAATSRATAAVHSHLVYLDPAGRRMGDAVQPPPEESALDYLEARAGNRRETYLTGVLFRRDAFDAIGGYPVFRTGLASDDAFLFALALRDRLVSSGSAVASIRLHGDAESRAAQGGLEKLETVDEFCAYCRQALDATGPSEAQRRRLEGALRRYAVALKSYWWQVTFRAARAGAGGYSRADLPRLRALVERDPSSYAPRVRFGIWLEKKAGIDLEGSTAYRAAGRFLYNVRASLSGRARLR